jgi:hypothetical protein
MTALSSGAVRAYATVKRHHYRLCKNVSNPEHLLCERRDRGSGRASYSPFGPLRNYSRFVGYSEATAQKPAGRVSF